MAEAGSLSFAADIRPLFTDIDVAHMQGAGMDLSNRDDVEKHAKNILAVVTDGSMPPPGTGERWTPDMCAKFQRWMEAGCPA